MSEAAKTPVMTPEEFAAKMRKIYEGRYDLERYHGDADDLMVLLLRQLGYGEGVDLFEGSERWYS